jgi:hypothetical protein
MVVPGYMFFGRVVCISWMQAADIALAFTPNTDIDGAYRAENIFKRLPSLVPLSKVQNVPTHISTYRWH